MKRITSLLLLALFFTTLASAYTGWIQQQDIKTSAQCTALGAALGSCLPLDTQIYITANGLDETLAAAISGGAFGGSGTVTSCGLSLPSIFTVTGSPVTTSGTLTATFASQSANLFLASPNGSSGAPSMRSIVAADVPTLNQNTTGNASTATAATNITGGADGYIPYQTASGTTTFLPIGSNTNLLTISGGVPVWEAVPTWNQNTTGTAAGLSSTLTVSSGGTGSTSFTAYAPLCAGSTTTGALASCSSGMSNNGYVLTSNGTSAAPTWQAPGSPAFSGLTTDGVMYAASSTTVASTPAGSGGQVLTSAGGNSTPSFRAFVPPTIQKFTSGSGTYYPSYVFVVSSANATAGATYTNNSQTFTVSTTISSGAILATTVSSSTAPTSSGTLTKASGTGDSTITFYYYELPLYDLVEAVGGGGGGSGSSTSSNGGAGTNGGATTFGSSLITSNGGGGATGAAGGTPGQGGTSSVSSPAIQMYAVPGGNGQGNGGSGTGVTMSGGQGGSSCLGGGGSGGGVGYASGSGSTNTGGGGGGASVPGASGVAGGGGGGGGCAKALLPSPTSEAYCIGNSGSGCTGGGAGTAGSGGSGGSGGGGGALGQVIVEEHYQ